jgi:hypothetical protein
MMRLLASNTDDIWGGKITPPIPGLATDSPAEAVGKIIGVGINLFILVSFAFVLLYLFWGAFDWIVSAGEKEKITKAQNKITNAVIGLFLVIGVLTLFSVITDNIFGLDMIQSTGSGWVIRFPTF